MADERKPHIAFAHIGGADWSAGSIFYTSLFHALRSLEDSRRPKISLLVSSREDRSSYAELSRLVDAVLEYAEPQASSSRITRILRRIAAPVSPSVDRFLKENNVDLLFATSLSDQKHSLPVIGWIPDFQHVRLPEMFTQGERDARDLHFRRLTNACSRIIVTSGDVLKDLNHFAPGNNKGVIVRFAASIPPEAFEGEPARVCQGYNLPQKFFHLPNQFWKHKNHMLVLEALALARKTHPEITVVCTGNLRDYRHPNYLNDLLLQISKLDLRDNFIILGLVPRQDVFALMRRSLAVLQPSLFEGLSMTVQEARMLGKTVLAADIPVLRELAPEGTTFFDPLDSMQLAKLLVRQQSSKEPGVDRDSEELALRRAPAMVQEFARSFMNAVDDVLLCRK
ncbi:MAG TPA: glycosyltransferase [Candidatus Obscuribacterales bacterium]